MEQHCWSGQRYSRAQRDGHTTYTEEGIVRGLAADSSAQGTSRAYHPRKIDSLDVLRACHFQGVLLYGPPGCGKTMIAKATAREAKTRFINLDVSILTDKWYGESQKLAAAVFSLAVKLQPCIIFIDEIGM